MRFKKFSMALVLFGLILLPATSQATTLRSLSLKDLSTLSRSTSSLAFKGKVLAIKESKTHRVVKFEVQELLRGDSQGKNQIELNFRKPVELKAKGWYQPALPQFKTGEESVLFVTRNLNGEDFFIGTEDQSRFYVKNEQGKSLIWNNRGNKDFIDAQSNNPLMKSIVRDMQSRKEGSLSYEDFKKLLDASELSK